MNIYSLLKNLAKSTRNQNRFLASKEINGINLFKNLTDFSKLQEIYLSYLYNYDNISRDIIVEKISKHVLNSEIYEEAYLLWKRKHTNNIEKKDNKNNELSLIPGKTIKFPKRD